MKKTTKAIALLAASTMLAVSLTACGTPANTVFSADDLKGKKIGAQLGTTGYVYAGDVEDATVEPYNKGADAVQALKQGKLDAVIIDSEPAKAFVAKNDVSLLFTGSISFLGSCYGSFRDQQHAL